VIGLAAQVRTLRLFAAPGKPAPSPAKKGPKFVTVLTGCLLFRSGFPGLAG